MEIQGKCLDHVLYKLYLELDRNGQPHTGSRGPTLELLSVTARILKPRARISRSENRGRPFSALGEMLWYLSGSDALDFIQPYVPEYAKDAVNGGIYGAYGPRFLAMQGKIDQFASIEQLLTKTPGSRRAVIQLFGAEDIAKSHIEVPCTTTLQFHLRNGLLHMSANLRSNDAYWGLPHDVFCFTMIQEMMARRLGVEIGEYFHHVGSMHVYEDFLDSMREYIAEGIHRTIEMPAMPVGDPFMVVDRLLDVDGRLRAGETLQADEEMADAYWADIVRLLQVFWAKNSTSEHVRRIEELRADFVSSSYLPYIDGRLYLAKRLENQKSGPNQTKEPVE